MLSNFHHSVEWSYLGVLSTDLRVQIWLNVEQYLGSSSKTLGVTYPWGNILLSR